MQKTTLQYGNSKPSPIEVQKDCGMKIRIINFDVTEANVENYDYCWKRVTLPVSIWNYAAIVAAIINAAYPADDMQAINNNYLRTLDGTDLDPDKKAEYLAEHIEMNAYRDHAKTVANELLAYAQEHNL